MDVYEKAMNIYEEIKDMDYMDYAENYDSDIDYIAGMIMKKGYSKTLAILTADY
jgi:hypothetical protein